MSGLVFTFTPPPKRARPPPPAVHQPKNDGRTTISNGGYTFSPPIYPFSPEHIAGLNGLGCRDDSNLGNDPDYAGAPRPNVNNGLGDEADDGNKVHGDTFINNAQGDEAGDYDRSNGENPDDSDDEADDGDGLGDETGDHDRDDGDNPNADSDEEAGDGDGLGNEAGEADEGDDGDNPHESVITELDLVRIFNLTGDEANIGTAEELAEMPALNRIGNTARIIENQLLKIDRKAGRMLRYIRAKMAQHEETHPRLYPK